MSDSGYGPRKGSYASPYYDPVKAHEYYEAHKQLKGRRSTGSLNDQGKEAWAYVKENVAGEKKKEISKAKDEQDKKIVDARAKATETRERITAKLQRLNTILNDLAKAEKDRTESKKQAIVERETSNAKSAKEQISEMTNRRIALIQSKTLAEGASKEEKAKFAADNKPVIAPIRGQAQTDKSQVSERSTAKKTEARTSAANEKTAISEEAKTAKSENASKAKAQREACATELKNTILAARNAYKARKSGINENYETIFQREYDKIAAEYSKKK